MSKQLLKKNYSKQSYAINTRTKQTATYNNKTKKYTPTFFKLYTICLRLKIFIFFLYYY